MGKAHKCGLSSPLNLTPDLFKQTYLHKDWAQLLGQQWYSTMAPLQGIWWHSQLWTRIYWCPAKGLLREDPTITTSMCSKGIDVTTKGYKLCPLSPLGLSELALRAASAVALHLAYKSTGPNFHMFSQWPNVQQLVGHSYPKALQGPGYYQLAQGSKVGPAGDNPTPISTG